jgi:type VI secretion system FHA domain protein
LVLTLEVSSAQGEKPRVWRQEFTELGGVIGRSNESVWVLPNAKVSGRHALITCRNGVFYIEDTSRNGIGLNSPDNRLTPGRPYPLTSGDHLFIEPYDILVSVSGSAQDVTRPQFAASNPFGGDDPFAQPSPLIDSSIAPPSDGLGQELDPLKLIDPLPNRAPVRKAPEAKDLELGSVLDDHYQPPAVIPAAPPPRPAEPSAIPANYNPLADDSQMFPLPSPPAAPPLAARLPEPVPQQPLLPVAPRRPSPGAASPPHPVHHDAPPGSSEVHASDLAAMLAGAGLPGAAVTPELARNFGEILRVVVEGVMDILQARQQIKEEFQMGITHFRPADNNPLKFSANVDDALHNLLVKRNAAYLGPVEAFADAFEDLRNHQMAMLAGMRVAFDAMLAEFQPDRLEEQFNRQANKGALLRVPGPLRYWNLYRDKCRDMVRDPEANFRELFGEAFARAYEAQLKRLRAEAHESSKKRR